MPDTHAPPSGGKGSPWFEDIVILLTLVAFAVAQAVYDTLASNPDFLAARRVTNAQLLGVIGVYGLLPAVVIGLLWAGSHRLGRGLHRGLFCAVIAVFSLALFWQARNTYLGDGDEIWRSPWLWIVPSLALAFLAWRQERGVRSFLLALSPAILLFPALFLYRTWRSPITPPAMVVSAEASTNAAVAPNGTPVVFLVFDELGLHSLLNSDGKIDPERYPNFAQLAAGSHWFRNATSNSSKTITAIAAIASGKLPTGLDSNHSNYPNTAFSLLAPSYDILIEEVGNTNFCDSEAFHCLNDASGDGTAGLLRDVGYLYAGRVVPAKLDIGLPDTSHTWGPFQTAEAWTEAALARSRRVLHAADAMPASNALFFSHLILPHSPYTLTPDGETYAVGPYALDDGQDTATLTSLMERYRQQVGYVDRWLGEFLDRLKQRGVYDPALLIVTGDHGVSWKPEAAGRVLREENAEMMLSVPLFVKLPYQQEAAYSERDVQHIDLVPTIADVLEMPLPFPVQGRSVLGPVSEPRLKVAYGERMERFEFDPGLGLRPVETHPQVSSLVGLPISRFTLVEDKFVRGKLRGLQIAPAGTPDFAAATPVLVAGWALRMDPAAPAIEVHSGASRSGENSLAFQGAEGGARYPVSELAADSRYVAGAWVRSGSGREGRVSLRVTTNSGVILETAEIRPGREFQQMEVTFTAPEDGQALIELDFQGGPGQVFWDDVSVAGVAGESAASDGDAPQELVVNGGFEEPLKVPWAVYGHDDQGPAVQPLEVAVTLNGEIVAAARPGAERWDIAKQVLLHPKHRYLRCGWSVSIPAKRLREGENPLEAYLVLDADRRIAMKLDSGHPRVLVKNGDSIDRKAR